MCPADQNNSAGIDCNACVLIPDATYTDNRVNMTNAFAEVQTGQVTFAARDSDYDGHNIKQGEILGLENGKLAFTEKDITKAVYKLIKSLVKRDSSFVTMIYGADVSDAQAEKAYEAISAKLRRFGGNQLD